MFSHFHLRIKATRTYWKQKYHPVVNAKYCPTKEVKFQYRSIKLSKYMMILVWNVNLIQWMFWTVVFFYCFFFPPMIFSLRKVSTYLFQLWLPHWVKLAALKEKPHTHTYEATDTYFFHRAQFLSRAILHKPLGSDSSHEAKACS